MELEELRKELEAVKAALQAHEKSAVGSSSTPSSTPSSTAPKQIYVASGRRLERFRNAPEKSGDPSIREWVSDVRGQLASRQLTTEEGASFILDHLAGKARQEVLGRGDEVAAEPEEIFRVLLKVFGDGDTLPQLQQKFFSYRQGPQEDLLTCSLELVELFTRMAKLDEACEASRERTLKGRLAEAVRDEGLQRELRRLNMEAPTLSFFDVRDRAIEWLGRRQGNLRKEAAVQEVKAADSTCDMKALLEKQGQQLQHQQQQIDALIKALSERPRGWSQPQPRRCYTCQSTGHLKRNCPHRPRGNGSPSEQAQRSMFNPRAQQFTPEQSVPQQSTQPQFVPQHPSFQQPLN
ncbi:uncharacterized protein LOC110990338 [Acanthaster planci]|uniref:Uncharacterized protein LOC110990338 n=1 Tax=Acanthaster planci TaxID=133434 RepID=A0A8B8A4X0_ACAPL|nr:uncharacterized protein LOC110990338 [Acanthaster planci]